jgi:hypothetical protein
MSVATASFTFAESVHCENAIPLDVQIFACEHFAGPQRGLSADELTPRRDEVISFSQGWAVLAGEMLYLHMSRSVLSHCQCGIVN